ncbi:hypothetical protein [Geobacter sp. AOG2]|uniref:hypothetical protein n=1 Tax=Geobacter sp. AOG2 TaxID=1566347 RepID=UPI001CC80A54|nr:hypothetical protein [Geobacter sp. AOG2]
MMRTHLILTIALTLLTCSALHASDKCVVIEYPDHVEAGCTGNSVTAPVSPDASATRVAAPTVETAPQESTVAISAAPAARNEFMGPDSQSPPLPQAPGSHQQRRLAVDTMENAKAARLLKIMNSRQ